MKGRLLLTLIVASGCSPLGPGECRNGKDGIGRGPFTEVWVECTQASSGVQCRADRVEWGYCAELTRDVTSVSRWISTNPSVAAFTSPGQLEIRAIGGTAVYAEFESYYSPQVFGFFVDPAGNLQRVGVVDVQVFNTSTGGVLPLTNVEFTPQTGGAQTCQQGPGAPYTPCRFWSDLSPGVVRASKSGYAPAQQTVTPEPPNPADRATYVSLKLSPL